MIELTLENLLALQILYILLFSVRMIGMAQVYLRDKILMKADIDINIWLNETYNKDHWDVVSDEIKRLINR